jgi:hypothetical protein
MRTQLQRLARPPAQLNLTALGIDAAILEKVNTFGPNEPVSGAAPT